MPIIIIIFKTLYTIFSPFAIFFYILIIYTIYRGENTDYRSAITLYADIKIFVIQN